MVDDLIWWIRDAADSICSQTGAKTHSDKLHEAINEILKLRSQVEKYKRISASLLIDGGRGG